MHHDSDTTLETVSFAFCRGAFSSEAAVHSLSRVSLCHLQLQNSVGATQTLESGLRRSSFPWMQYVSTIHAVTLHFHDSVVPRLCGQS